MSKPAIRALDLSKRYLIGGVRPPVRAHEALEGLLRRPLRRCYRAVRREPLVQDHEPESPDDYIWAVRHVSFDVSQGDVVGVIGRNGAGKSVLLKILSRVTPPTAGNAEIRGRVTSLLELGAAFHPELTGRENVYLNGGILGMRRAEIARKFDEIVAFSEVDKFLDAPVKHYSSGMYMRLAFGVAAHLEGDILLLDEVLAVGDESFQNKCVAKIRKMAADGRTVLFVSHGMKSVERLCSRAILLHDGRLVADGGTREVISRYHESVAASEGR